MKQAFHDWNRARHLRLAILLLGSLLLELYKYPMRFDQRHWPCHHDSLPLCGLLRALILILEILQFVDIHRKHELPRQHNDCERHCKVRQAALSFTGEETTYRRATDKAPKTHHAHLPSL